MFVAAAAVARVRAVALAAGAARTARHASSSASKTASPPSDEVVVTDLNGVRTMRMNRPDKLNAWTATMMLRLRKEFQDAAADSNVKAAIVTGTGRYYCAGVDLSATIRPMHPKALFNMIESNNRALFDSYLDFPKPILIAANGPAVGASVTSATLCDAILAAEEATFNTPFAALGVPPEGCSSVHFADIMGEAAAQRMLGEKGWKPTAAEALVVGLVEGVHPADELQARAQELAEQWVADGKPREIKGKPWAERAPELKRVNAEESRALATAFLSADFIERQRAFLESKGKHKQATTFKWLGRLRPLWSLLL